MIGGGGGEGTVGHITHMLDAPLGGVLLQAVTVEQDPPVAAEQAMLPQELPRSPTG